MAKAAMVGFLTGRGLSSNEIERELGDGTISATIRTQWKRWQLPREEIGGPSHRRVFIELTHQEKKRIARQAREHGLDPGEYMRHIAVYAIRDDLYDAITDNRYRPTIPIMVRLPVGTDR